MAWQPNLPYTTPAMLQNPIGETLVKGVKQKQYGEGERVFVSFRTFGGTEKTSNGQVVVENTATIETWYRPDITPASRFEVDGTTYEVLGTPENIGMRNQYLAAKVRAVKGGA